MANTDKILPGYEESVGAKLFAIVDHYGPSSYVNGTGEVYPASNLQRGGFDAVEGSVSFSGTYEALVFYGSTNIGNGVPSVTLRWYVVSTGAEVANATNLSAEAVRLKVFMY